jgi:hypothetical protein
VSATEQTALSVAAMSVTSSQTSSTSNNSASSSNNDASNSSKSSLAMGVPLVTPNTQTGPSQGSSNLIVSVTSIQGSMAVNQSTQQVATINTQTLQLSQQTQQTQNSQLQLRGPETSEFKTSNSTFFVKSVKLDNIGYISGGTNGTGCFGKTFTLKAYNSAGTALAMDTGTAMSLFITIPSDSVTATAGTFTKTDWVSVSSPADWNKVGSAGYTEATGTGEITIGNLGISGEVTKITLESS